MRILAGSGVVLCGDSDCLFGGGAGCGGSDVFSPLTCVNRVALMSLDAVLLLTFLLGWLLRSNPRVVRPQAPSWPASRLRFAAAVCNGCLGLAYLASGGYEIGEEVVRGRGVLPLYLWVSPLLHGFTWVLAAASSLSVGSSLSGRACFKLWMPGVAVILAVFLCVSAVLEVALLRIASVDGVLGVLSLPGAILLILATFKRDVNREMNGFDSDPLLMPHEDSQEADVASDDHVTPFAAAGFFSRASFWWLNPLMSRGYEKPLEDRDIPRLCEEDRARTCYGLFVEKLERQEQASVFWTIVDCYRREIFVSGFFALIKILTVSSGPVMLNLFIKMAEGGDSVRLEGFLLALALFLLKLLESVAQRQWYFRTRALGLKVRSLLSAAIYQKQLKLSHAAKMIHSSGEIMNYVTVDAYRIGEFPYYMHQTWTTILQLCIASTILYNVMGLAAFASLSVIILTVLSNTPLAKLQHRFQSKLMEAQDERLKALTEALVNMKVLKLYAWESHFMVVIEQLRKVEVKWLSAFQLRRGYNTVMFWGSPIIVSGATFFACYFLGTPLDASNIFTFVATLRLVQDPIRAISDVVGVVIQARVAFARIVRFLDASELQNACIRKNHMTDIEYPIMINSASFSWEQNSIKPTLKNVVLKIRHKDKVAICGEVGSGKSSLLAAVLGEIPSTEGLIQVSGSIAYVSQTSWIPTGTIQENILFGAAMDKQRYQDTLEKCSLVKDLAVLPFSDLTEIGERGVNLSGGQKQRLQLARALYQDADIYLLDDPFSAVDAHTATSLFKNYVMDALAEKTVLLVTHQVDFLPSFDSILLMSEGEIVNAASYHVLMNSSMDFMNLVDAHKETVGSGKLDQAVRHIQNELSTIEIKEKFVPKNMDFRKGIGEQLIRKEEREKGGTTFKPYMQYLGQNKGFLYLSIAVLSHIGFIAGQISQNSWMAGNVQNPQVSQLRLITVYFIIGCCTIVLLCSRSLFVVTLGVETSKSLFSQLLKSLFRAPMSFFDSTPIGRILSRVSSDLSIVDLDVPFSIIFSIAAALNALSNLGVLAVITWQVLLVSLLMIYLTLRLQRYYLATSKELMRINGTTKSLVANHLAESVAGAITIRAFKEEERFFTKNLELIDRNASPFFHNYAATEWLIQRLETMCAILLSTSALIISLLPHGTLGSGFIGMALSYGLSLNMSVVFSIQNQCILASYIISVERLNQYMAIPSEAAEILEDSRPPPSWPPVGKVDFQDLKIRYRPGTPLVLHGISCTFEGGYKIGIVGRTGSGKTTLIGALFRLVEPAGGRILVDGLDIATIGLHDLRSRLAIIPQDPTLFSGTIRYNLDPLAKHTDKDIWEVLEKCQLNEAVREKDLGLDSLVMDDGSNWSLGQRQLFCLCRALLRRSRIIVLDEATASIDNATDAILQKTIRLEFANSTVITVAHRIPTVMDCTMVVAINNGRLAEFDEPKKLMLSEKSLFAQLVNEYWSHTVSRDNLQD